MSTADEAAAPANDDIESVFDIYGTNENAAEDGKWFQIGKQLRVKLRAYRSTKSLAVLEELMAPYRRAGRPASKLDRKTQTDIEVQHLAKGIVVDWEGVYDSRKSPVPHSVNAVITLLTKLPDMRIAWGALSSEMSNFRDEEKKAVEGN